MKLWCSFKEDIEKAHLSFNTTTHFNDGRTDEIREDIFTSSMDTVQNDTLQSAPRKGKAVITSTTLLIGGVPEVSVTCFHCIAFDLIEFIQANYTVIVQVTATQGVVFHLWSQFEMLYNLEELYIKPPYLNWSMSWTHSLPNGSGDCSIKEDTCFPSVLPQISSGPSTFSPAGVLGAAYRRDQALDHRLDGV